MDEKLLRRRARFYSSPLRQVTPRDEERRFVISRKISCSAIGRPQLPNGGNTFDRHGENSRATFC